MIRLKKTYRNLREKKKKKKKKKKKNNSKSYVQASLRYLSKDVSFPKPIVSTAKKGCEKSLKENTLKYVSLSLAKELENAKDEKKKLRRTVNIKVALTFKITKTKIKT